MTVANPTTIDRQGLFVVTKIQRTSIVSNEELMNAMSYAKARVWAHLSNGSWQMINRSDLLSAAYEGVTEALHRFEPKRGGVQETKFTSYAHFWIEKYIKEFIARNRTIVSSSLSDSFRGLTPYAYSIDIQDDDAPSQDHQIGLKQDCVDLVEQSECNQAKSKLVKLFLKKLDSDFDRTCLQLHFGIQTIDNKAKNIKEIAKLTQVSKRIVTESLERSMSMLKQYSDTGQVRCLYSQWSD